MVSPNPVEQRGRQIPTNFWQQHSQQRRCRDKEGEQDQLKEKGETRGQSLHQAAPKGGHKDKRFFSAMAGFKLDSGRGFFLLNWKDINFTSQRGKGEAKWV